MISGLAQSGPRPFKESNPTTDWYNWSLLDLTFQFGEYRAAGYLAGITSSAKAEAKAEQSDSGDSEA